MNTAIQSHEFGVMSKYMLDRNMHSCDLKHFFRF